jgi:hypothetical protein
MPIPIDWQGIENASPENRELGEVVRRLGGIHEGNSSLDWKESRRRCVEVLNFESGILLTDAAPRNVRIVDGAIALFDAIASLASDEVLAAMEKV